MTTVIDLLPAASHLPRRPLSGRTLRVLGNPLTVLLSAEETRGQISVLELEHAEGSGSPRHVHEDESELLYVLAGVYEVELDGAVRLATPGDLVWLPDSVPHAYRAVQGPARALAFCISGGIERLFADLDALGAHAADDPALLARTMTRHGVSVLPALARQGA